MPGIRRHIADPVKEVVVRMNRYGLSRDDIKKYTTVSPSAQRRICALYRRTGEVSVRPYEVGRKRVLNGLDMSFLEGCIERTPDISLRELQSALEGVCDIRVSLSTIHRSLRRRGYSYKKLERPALERNEDDRAAYMLRIGTHYDASQLVFVDESHVNRFTTRRSRGWAPVGSRSRRRDFFIRGTRYSMVPALSLDGIVTLDVFTRPLTKQTFNKFIEHLLDCMNPFPQRNSVLVMDNASIHCSDELREMVEARGMRLEYLPAYSPDLNPIEEAFSSIKAWIRSNRDYVLGELTGDATADPYEMIWKAVFSVTAEDARGWFSHSGYLVR